ncbi:MAG TPA: type I 3-dehydroquinate dehydratase [Spirochaetota bacterium]|nr:type I 3-dehydroquinate dehydratase [Spirochaetota bacterium]HPR37693.1 type I 3-dehydroquinate dehydratase [Spirochaetota bacterium]
MICVSIADVTADEACRIIREHEISEVRLDRIKFSDSDLEKIFTSGKTVATFRPVDGIDDEKRINILKAAIKHGASYIDIEVENNDAYKNELKETAAITGCKTIVSYHDYKKTPVMRELEQLITWCFEGGADLAKIACQANSMSDAARLLSLYSLGKPVISIGMGKEGKITRIAASLLGAPFTYASLDAARETAPGQIDAAKLKQIIDMIRNS